MGASGRTARRALAITVLLGLGLAGCMSRTARVESLLDHGLPGQACDASDGKADAQVEAHMWDQLDLRMAMAPIPKEAFGMPIRGYGEEWMLMEVAINRRPGVVDTVTVSSTLNGWRACAECTQEWMQYQLGEDGPTRELPKPGPARRKRGKGRFKALATLGKIIAAPVILLTTGSLDLVTLPGERARGRKGFGLTGKALRWLLDDGHGGSGSGHLAVMKVRGTNLQCTSDNACIGHMPYRRVARSGPSQMRVQVSARGTERECVFEASQSLVLPEGAYPGRLETLVPDDGFVFRAEREAQP